MPWRVTDAMDQKIRSVARGVVPGRSMGAVALVLRDHHDRRSSARNLRWTVAVNNHGRRLLA